MPPTRGAIAFATFLDENKITLQAAATDLHVQNPTIFDWRRGTKRPRSHHRMAIETWTRGAVPASWWMTDEELSQLSVRPFEPVPEVENEADSPAEEQAPSGTEG